MTVVYARNAIARHAFFYMALLMSVLITPSLTTAASEPQGELTLRGALEMALARNPQLAVASYELQIADARIAQASVRRNPVLAVEFENALGSGELSGVKSLETTLSLSQTLELGNKRLQRMQVAQLNRELSGVDRQAQQLDVLAEVTRLFIDVVAAQHDVALAREALTLAEQTLAEITVRVQAARTPLAEQSRATIAVSRARIEQQRADNRLQSTRRALAAAWGARRAEFSQASADLFALPELQSYESLRTAVENTPDFLRFASAARLSEAELRLAQAQARADLTLSAGVRRLEASDDMALVAGVSMALPVFNRNQGEIREAEFKREQSRTQSQAVLIRAESTLYGLYQQLLTARFTVQTLQGEAISQAQTALAQTQTGYERGRFSYLELAAAQQELLALRRAAIGTAADYHRLISEIERLTNQALIDPTSIKDSHEAVQP